MTDGTVFPPVEELIPHRGSMILLDSVVAYGAESLRATASVHPDAWYADDNGAMPAWVGLEVMAQAIAAYGGLQARERGESVKVGFLLGARRFRATVPAFAPGVTLEVSATVCYRETNGLGAMKCVIASEAGVLAEATLSVFEPDDAARLLERVAS